MVAHEYAHAEAAYRQGDDTAYVLGRLTMNPLKHIDPFMTVILPVTLWFASGGKYAFGAAKPVPVNPRKYRQYVKGDIVVSLAGIAVNLVLFAAFSGAFAVIGVLGEWWTAAAPTLRILQQMAHGGMYLNLVLAFFNVIPIPPLDGSHVLFHLLPPAAGLRFSQLYRFGFLPILLISWLVPGVINALLWPADRLMDLGNSLVGGFAIGGLS